MSSSQGGCSFALIWGCEVGGFGAVDFADDVSRGAPHDRLGCAGFGEPPGRVIKEPMDSVSAVARQVRVQSSG